MKEKFITLIALLTLCLPGKAQVTVTLNQLNGTVWKQIYPDTEDKPTTLSFSNTTAETTMEFRKDDILKFQQKYYLTDRIPSEFDFTSVGNKNSGTYLIIYNDKTRRVLTHKVISISDDTLKLHYLPIPGTIIGNKNGIDIIYKRVK
ncbi:MAG: hypothetical protein NC124_16810 [Clostridium sp.]|nr:hypothetical protein [Bacteroidales bacterium]MCM1207257.1 hypothetical protein [Bacillota bacterium]MCM1500126.1 hypothetical protein [Clostridium sp.]